jgi:hypothetical protein
MKALFQVSVLFFVTILSWPLRSQAGSPYAFATSKWGPGDMHSWADANSTDFYGLEAADKICQARAASAGLDGSENYVAWLSDRDNDAYCRIFGLTGKKADQCGQSELPVGAGPWLRVDGIPFAAKIEDALSAGEVYSPLNVDEFGHSFFVHAQSFTATDYEGRFNTQFEEDGDCEKWTSAVLDLSGPFPTLGSNLGTTNLWTFDESGVSCNATRRLICLERGNGQSLSGHARYGRREAFVSSAEVSGDLDGFAGADAVCQSSAAAAGMYRPESFKALLASSSTGTAITDRIAFDGEWYRRDGLLFAHNKAELTNGPVTLPLNVTEWGDYVGLSVALTGARADGSPFPDLDCNGWSSLGGMVSGSVPNMVAFAQTGGQEWLNVAQVPCAQAPPEDWPLRLYCLSDTDVLFHDGMDESRPDL